MSHFKTLSLAAAIAIGFAVPAGAATLTLIPLQTATTVAQSGPPTIASTCSTPNRAASVASAYWEYPDFAMQRDESGVADVRITLAANGAVQDASILNSSGSTALDTSALRTAHLSSFSPERSNCVAVGGTYMLEVDYAH